MLWHILRITRFWCWAVLKYLGHFLPPDIWDFIAGVHAERHYSSQLHVIASNFRQHDSQLLCHWACCVHVFFSKCWKGSVIEIFSHYARCLTSLFLICFCSIRWQPVLKSPVLQINVTSCFSCNYFKGSKRYMSRSLSVCQGGKCESVSRPHPPLFCYCGSLIQSDMTGSIRWWQQRSKVIGGQKSVGWAFLSGKIWRSVCSRKTSHGPLDPG